MSTTEQTINTTLRTRTTVLPGKRVEFVMPQLEEGAEVEVFVMPHPTLLEKSSESDEGGIDILDFLSSLPQSPTPRGFATWEEYEAFLRKEKNAWER